MTKLILFIATSKDGFIADSNGGVDWLPQPKDDADLAKVGYTDLMARIDTILMGRRSYDQIVGFGEWGWPDKHTIVFTSNPTDTGRDNISMTNERPHEVIAKLIERKSGRDIWLLGGAELARSIEGLTDEIILTVTPHVLGTGIPLDMRYSGLQLLGEKDLIDGMIQRHYVRKET